MTVGVKVDPNVIAAGTVVQILERRAFVSPADRALGVQGDVESHEVRLLQDGAGMVQVRFRVRDGLGLPSIGEFAAVQCRVSEGSFKDDNGLDRQFVNLVAEAPAYNALDLIQSNLAAA